jgi:hypothetical protein
MLGRAALREIKRTAAIARVDRRLRRARPMVELNSCRQGRDAFRRLTACTSDGQEGLPAAPCG